MRAVFRLLVLLGSGFAAVTSCALEESGLSDDPDGGAGVSGAGAGGSGGNVDCWGAEYKVCDGDCQEVSDPDFGCNATSCSPCGLPFANAKCESNQCKIESCLGGHADCDITEFNHDATGCETDTLNNPGHCGACGNNCFDIDPTKNWECKDGACRESNCPIGSANCGPNGECQSISSDPAQCGACGAACSLPNATPTCVQVPPPVIGECQIGGCVGGWADCDGAALTGCEINTDNDLANCGGCNQPCTAPANGIPFCSGGACDFVCQAPFIKCGNACVNPASDVANCGGCGNACSAPAGGVPFCSNGSCDFNCPTAPNNSKCAGQCVNTQTNPAHCGNCGNVCSAPTGGTVSCTGGGCVPNCQGLTQCGNTCVNTQTDKNNCGGCGTVCPHEQICNNGSCGCPGGQPVGCASSCEPQCCPGSGACSPPTNGTCQGNGTCGCPAGTKNCSGTCQQCCGNPDCTGGKTCQGGTCACPAGWKSCNGGTTCSPECCTNADCTGGPAGEICLPGGTCGCGGSTPIDCNGTCRACCDSGDVGCGGPTPQCCASAGYVCRECCGDPHCSGSDDCCNGQCQPSCN